MATCAAPKPNSSATPHVLEARLRRGPATQAASARAAWPSHNIQEGHNSPPRLHACGTLPTAHLLHELGNRRGARALAIAIGSCRGQRIRLFGLRPPRRLQGRLFGRRLGLWRRLGRLRRLALASVLDLVLATWPWWVRGSSGQGRPRCAVLSTRRAAREPPPPHRRRRRRRRQHTMHTHEHAHTNTRICTRAYAHEHTHTSIRTPPHTTRAPYTPHGKNSTFLGSEGGGERSVRHRDDGRRALVFK